MPTPAQSHEPFTIFGEFGKASGEGRASGKAAAQDLIGAGKFLRSVGKLLLVLLLYTLIGVSAWGGLLLRRRIGMNFAAVSWAFGLLTLALFSPVARSSEASLLLNGWWLAVFFAGLLHVGHGLLRMYRGESRRVSHVHRWASGEPRRPVLWLFNVLPVFVANNRHVAKLREPIVLLLLAAAAWAFDALVLRSGGAGGDTATAIYLLPGLAAVSVVALALVGHTLRMYDLQKQRDAMFEQQQAGERHQSLHEQFHEQEIEGFVSVPQ